MEEEEKEDSKGRVAGGVIRMMNFRCSYGGWKEFAFDRHTNRKIDRCGVREFVLDK